MAGRIKVACLVILLSTLGYSQVSDFSCSLLRSSSVMESPQSSIGNPYVIEITNVNGDIVSTYTPGDQLTVTVTTVPSPDPTPLRQLFITASSASSSETSNSFIGGWIAPTNQTRECNGAPTVLEFFPPEKVTDDVVLQWILPSNQEVPRDGFLFRATVFLSDRIYWENVTSSVISPAPPSDPCISDPCLLGSCLRIAPTIRLCVCNGAPCGAPNINCPVNPPNVSVVTGGLYSAAWDNPPACFDAEGTPLVVQCDPPLDEEFSGLERNISCYCEDNAGSRGTCDFQFTVPDFICPIDQTVMTELGSGDGVTVFYEDPVITIPGAQPVGCTPGSEGTFPVGSNEVSCIAYRLVNFDFFFCSFFVTVVKVDTTPPTISGCPSDQEVETDFISLNSAVEWTAPTASDLSDSAELVSLPSQSPGDVFPIGQTELTYVFEDPSGNRAQCNFTVSVIPVGPLPESVIDTCPRNITTTVELGTPSATVTWTEPVPTGIPVSVMLASRSHSPGSVFPVGETTVSYLFEYGQNSTLSCLFAVTVETVDTTPPTISGCPSDQEVETDFISLNAAVEWTAPTASDLSESAELVSFPSQSPGDVFLIGQTELTYVFEDPSGNSAQCNFTVSVIPVGPLPESVIDACPGDITTTVELGTGSATVTWTEPVPTGIPVNVMLASRSHSPGGFFSVGETTVLYRFQYDQSSTIDCVFVVTVETVDTTPPMISGCPENQTEIIPFQAQVGQVTWLEPSATDQSGVPMLSSRTHEPGSNFSVGSTKVEYVFTDDSANQANCIFFVLVEEAPPNAPPNITCPFLESIPEGEVEPTCVDRETAARDLVATCEVSPVSPVLVILNCFCSDGDGGQAACQLEIPVIPTSVSTSTSTTTPLSVASTTPNENSTDPVFTDVSSQSMIATVPMPACPRLSIDNTEVVCIGPDSEDCYITCKAGTLNTVPSRELFTCVVTEMGARWSPRPLNVCQSPSLPLHVTGLMQIPLETNATICSELSDSMDSISNYFATITRSNFALFCDTAEVPFCADSLQGVETTQECYPPLGSSARRRRQADQEVMINVTLQVRANMTKEEIVRFLEQTRMDLTTGGTRQIPLTGEYTAELTDAAAERIVIDEDQFIFTCNPGYANLKESGCVLCPAGTSEVNGRCQYCSRGSFQDRPGQTTCVKCTQKEGVLAGSDTRADCKSIPEKEAREVNVLLIAFIILAGILALLVLGLLVVLCITICCCQEEGKSKHESAGKFLDMRSDGNGSQEVTAENHAYEESDENDSAIGSDRKQDHDAKEMFVAIEDESVDPDFEMENPTYDSTPTIAQVGMYEEEMSAL